MLLQIATDYPGLPDVRTLAIGEIVFFYNGLRKGLWKHTRREPTTTTTPPRRRGKR